jgi:acyl-CoA thioesterase
MSTRAAGNTYLPFVDLMRLETINDVTFRSTAQPFCPGGTHIKSAGRAYGGHVYAQAVWAAAQTVPEGFVLHVSCLPIVRNSIVWQYEGLG